MLVNRKLGGSGIPNVYFIPYWKRGIIKDSTAPQMHRQTPVAIGKCQETTNKLKNVSFNHETYRRFLQLPCFG